MKVRDILPSYACDITVRTNGPNGIDILFGFLQWDGKYLISLDGDDYSFGDEVINYCFEEDGSLTYWIRSEWA